ncbi:MAG: dihydropteroate synthase [Nevskiales bacterium]
MQLRCRTRVLDLAHPVVMGVLNVTPDSFSDGGRWVNLAAAIEHAQQMIAEGAALIDVGGESTRPGAEPVTVEEELRRVIPVIERLTAEFPDAFISVDTMKPETMRAACAAGVELVNDVNALRAHDAVAAVSETKAAVCLMHMQGEPRTMQRGPQYVNVVPEVRDYLLGRAEACEDAGIARDKILLDPGFGFGKALPHNLSLLARLDELTACGYPILVGMSRKSMLGAVLGTPPLRRVHGHDAAVALAVWQGARIIRTHDVRATLASVKVATEVMAYKGA